MITLSGFHSTFKFVYKDPKRVTVAQRWLAFGCFSIKIVFKKIYTVKPVYNGHPWDPKILTVVDRWPLFRGFSIRIAIEFDFAGLRLAVVGRWPLFRGGR